MVESDAEKYFDRVNHDVLMARVERKVEDRRVLRLIRLFLTLAPTCSPPTPWGSPKLYRV
ncbi:group II intron-encoding maturase [mine drainage metagenome]|uniref:Group II intron-encoding maturase n=1 Tax=mine drainage metagenome TaxID=410659 RepID=T1BXE5_9ZZZZ